jgi:predicted enzyme related to lactoylglutathione lyase
MESSTFSKGGIVSADITTERADELRDFCQNVMGWTVEDMRMEDDAIIPDPFGAFIGLTSV